LADTEGTSTLLEQSRVLTLGGDCLALGGRGLALGTLGGGGGNDGLDFESLVSSGLSLLFGGLYVHTQIKMTKWRARLVSLTVV
jgi:hypothetical protein